jgi:hypothetical protein
MSSTKTKSSYGYRNVSITPDACAAEMRDMLALACGPRGWDDTRDSWLARGARYVGMDFSRAKNIWYGKSRRIEASEFLRMQQKINELRARQAANREAMDHVASKLASMGSEEIAEPLGDAD